MRRLMLVILMAMAAVPAAGAQRADPRSDAQIYFDAERSLQQTEANATCGGSYIRSALHRVIELRWRLLSLRRFANRDGELRRLNRSNRQEEDEEGLCVSSSGTEPALREATRHIRLLRQRLRRSRWQDPDARTRDATP
jgi:hypothetical protein